MENGEAKICDFVSGFAQTWKTLCILRNRTSASDASETPSDHVSSLSDPEFLSQLTEIENQVRRLTSTEVVNGVEKKLGKRRAKRLSKERQRKRIAESKRSPDDVYSDHTNYLSELIAVKKANDEDVAGSKRILTVTQKRKLKKISRTFELLKLTRKLYKLHNATTASQNAAHSDEFATSLLSTDAIDALEIRLKNLRRKCLSSRAGERSPDKEPISEPMKPDLESVLFGTESLTTRRSSAFDLVAGRTLWDRYLVQPSNPNSESVPDFFVFPPEKPNVEWAKYADFGCN